MLPLFYVKQGQGFGSDKVTGRAILLSWLRSKGATRCTLP